MKYEYMKESEQMLQYFQFPKFLLKLRISQTAKFLYMILYDRARISRKNSWIDKYGNVYLIFPIDAYEQIGGWLNPEIYEAVNKMENMQKPFLSLPDNQNRNSQKLRSVSM